MLSVPTLKPEGEFSGMLLLDKFTSLGTELARSTVRRIVRNAVPPTPSETSIRKHQSLLARSVAAFAPTDIVKSASAVELWRSSAPGRLARAAR